MANWKGYSDADPEAENRQGQWTQDPTRREEVRAFAQQGGKTLFANRGREYMRELGRKGGAKTREKGKEHFAEIGRKGALGLMVSRANDIRDTDRFRFHDLKTRLTAKIREHLPQWDDEKIEWWWVTHNQFFGGLTPIDFLARRPDKIERYVDSLLSGEGP